jgi:multidrug efflux system outer membrane protein
MNNHFFNLFRSRKFERLQSCLMIVCPMLLFLFSGCSLGPNYHRPDVEIPVDWHWKEAVPRDEESKGPWWEVFNDPELDRLQQLAVENNQNLKAAIARIDQARSHARVTAADFFPNVTADPSWQRYKTSPNTANNVPFPIQSITANDFKVPLDFSYEIDLWGKVRRSFESARNEMLASAADYENVLFTLQADVGENYYRLRGVDREIEIFNTAVELRQKNLDIFNARFKAGYTSQLEVVRSTGELSSAKANLADARRRHAAYLNALALLCGSAVSGFDVPSKSVSLQPPEIKPGLPSDLLERRPDIAEAERHLAAKNAEIGVAYAAFFPSIKLTGSAGFESAELSDIFSWESRVWSIGPSISIPISALGVNQARVNEVRGAYDEAVAQYRQSVLVAFRDVEDMLSALRFLKEQSGVLGEVISASRKAVELSTAQYKNGIVDYLNVIDAERTRLDNELQLVRVDTERMASTVKLVKAIGGGWDENNSKTGSK